MKANKFYTLQEWVESLQADLEKFVKAYKENHANNPDQWPYEMMLGDWDEQFQIFHD